MIALGVREHVGTIELSVDDGGVVQLGGRSVPVGLDADVGAASTEEGAHRAVISVGVHECHGRNGRILIGAAP